MTFLGASLADWTAFTAIGTLALALATVAAIIVNQRTVRMDRERDDARRVQDRERDDQLRRQEHERDARQRDELEQRYHAEQREREDFEARQVAVEMILAARVGGGPNLTHHVTVSTPVTYPIKWVDAQIAHNTNSGIGLQSLGYAFAQPEVEQGQTLFKVRAKIPDTMIDPAPIVRFTDRHGNLYYVYKQHTRRFLPYTEWRTAAEEIDKWLRTGPGASPES